MKHNKKNSNAKPSQDTKFTTKNIIIIAIAVIITIILYFTFFKSESAVKEDKGNNVVNKEMFSFKREGELTLINSEGGFIKKIDVELAENDDKRTQGLMYRTDLTNEQGMLFIFPYETYQSFWMRNTYLSLDMIFINSQHEIVTIHKNTTPFSDQSYPSSKPTTYVLEVPAGFCDKFGINVGDKIVWRRI